MHVWWATEVECVSSICRLERDGLQASIVAEALGRLTAMAEDWNEVVPGTLVRQTAKRLLRVHPLRAADSLQLAGAWVLADGEPASVEFISLDDRLRDAATREGFVVLPPTT
jgi:predicted nucleic acid-binding protein